jgi:hypothetical protein
MLGRPHEKLRWIRLGIATLALGGAAACSGGGAPTDAGGCVARPDLAAAAPACNTVTNGATAIAGTAAVGAAPTPAGGAIVDGLYEATKTEVYGGAPSGGRRLTLVVTGGGTRVLWAGEVLDATGTAVTLSFRADTAVAASGTKLTLTTSCVSTTPSPLPPALDYTATPTSLVLSLANGSTTAVTTYTRRGCAP